MNAPRWPVWAPVVFEYDRARAVAEAMALEAHFIPMPPHRSTVKQPMWKCAPDEWYDQIGWWSESGSRSGQRPTWRGINLTTLPGHPDTSGILAGANRVQGEGRGKWVWGGLSHQTPYLREIAESLPFEVLDVARVMTIPMGGFGPVHADKPEGEAEHSEKDFLGLTLQLDNGGVRMEVKARSGDHHWVDSPAFLFLDTAPHGVSTPKRTRVTYRIYGKVNYDKLKSMIDWSRAVW